MPWRNGPHARAPGWQAAPERLPRAIAARLKSAGYLTEIADTRDAAKAAIHDDELSSRPDHPDDRLGPGEQ